MDHHHCRHQESISVEPILCQWFKERIAQSGGSLSQANSSWQAVYTLRVNRDNYPSTIGKIRVREWRRLLPDYLFLLLYECNRANNGGAPIITIHGVVLLTSFHDAETTQQALTTLPDQCFANITYESATLAGLSSHAPTVDLARADGWCYALVGQFDSVAERMAPLWVARGDDRCTMTNAESNDGRCCAALSECYVRLYEALARCSKRTATATAASTDGDVNEPIPPLEHDLAQFRQVAVDTVREHYVRRLALTFCTESERAVDLKARMAMFFFIRSIRHWHTRALFVRAERLVVYGLVAEAWPREAMVERFLDKSGLSDSLACRRIALTAEVAGSFAHDWWTDKHGITLAGGASRIDWRNEKQHAIKRFAAAAAAAAITTPSALEDIDTDEAESMISPRFRAGMVVNSASVQQLNHVLFLPLASLPTAEPSASSLLVTQAVLDAYFEWAMQCTVRYHSFCYWQAGAAELGGPLCRFVNFVQARDAYLLQAHSHVLLYDTRKDVFVVAPPADLGAEIASRPEASLQQVLLDLPVHPTFAVDVGDSLVAMAAAAMSVHDVANLIALQFMRVLLSQVSATAISLSESINAETATDEQLLALARPVVVALDNDDDRRMYAINLSGVVVPRLQVLEMLCRQWFQRSVASVSVNDVEVDLDTERSAKSGGGSGGKRPRSTSQPMSSPAKSQAQATLPTANTCTAMSQRISLSTNDDDDDGVLPTVQVTVLLREGGLWPMMPHIARLHPAPSMQMFERVVLQRLDMHCYVNDPMGESVAPMVMSDGGGGGGAGDDPAPTLGYSSTAKPSDQAMLAAVELDTETSKWRYRRDVFRVAVLQRLRAFHSDASLVQRTTAPSWVLLVDKLPFLSCDADYAWQTCTLPLHQVLIYTDVPRWLATLHHVYATEVDKAANGDIATLLRVTGRRDAFDMLGMAMQVFGPLLLRVQGIDDVIARERQAETIGSAGGSSSSSNKLSKDELARRQAHVYAAYNSLDALLIEHASDFLPWLFDEPGMLMARGTNYRFRKGASMSVHVGNDDRRGMWKDFQSGRGGRGMIRLLRYVRHDDKQQPRVAYNECRQWLVKHFANNNNKSRSTTVAMFDDALFMSYYTNGANLLTADKIETIQRYSTPIEAGDHVMRYLCGTRGFGGVITARLLERWRGIDLIRCAPRDRYYTGENEYLTTPAMILWLHTPDGRRGRLQRTYLQESNSDGKVQKLRLESTDKPGEFLTAKKFRSCLEEANTAFAWLQASSVDDAPLLLAEGLETALSVAVALPEANVFVSGGVSSFKHFDWRTALPSARVVVLCRDNDTGVARVNTDEAARQAVEQLTQRGYQVHEVFPTDEQCFKDFNDVHQAHPGRTGSAMVADMLCSQLPLLRQCLVASEPASHDSHLLCEKK